MTISITPKDTATITVAAADASTVEAIAGALAATMREGGWRLISHTPGSIGAQVVVALEFGIVAVGEELPL